MLLPIMANCDRIRDQLQGQVAHDKFYMSGTVMPCGRSFQGDHIHMSGVLVLVIVWGASFSSCGFSLSTCF